MLTVMSAEAVTRMLRLFLLSPLVELSSGLLLSTSRSMRMFSSFPRNPKLFRTTWNLTVVMLLPLRGFPRGEQDILETSF